MRTQTHAAVFCRQVERLMLNGIGASQPMSSSGQITYYTNHRIGGASHELFGGVW